MEIRNEIVEEVVRRQVCKFIAFDGKEFKTKNECEMYEMRILRNQQIDKSEKLRIYELTEVIPVVVKDADPAAYFRWYKIESEDDFKLLEGIYDYVFDENEPQTYPDIVCIETDDIYATTGYAYYLSDMKEYIEDLFDKMGYEVEFKKVRDI